jgi:hypothetical protein
VLATILVLGTYVLVDRTQLGPALTGHTAMVTSLDFSLDGTKLLRR